MVREVLCSNPGPDQKVLKQKVIPGRFYGGLVPGHFSRSAVVQSGVSMRKMGREVLGSNPGPDRKNVRIGFRPPGIPYSMRGSPLGHNFKFQFVWALDSGMT